LLLLCISHSFSVAFGEGAKLVYRIASAQGLKTALEEIEKEIEKSPDSGGSIKVIAQGPVVKHLSTFPMVGRPTREVETLQKKGVSFEVCTYSVLDNKISVDQLLPGVRHLDDGAPRRVRELEAQGYELRER
jgi:intracellular sulfur oxidation DsrE/DsrF family protein